MIYWIPGILSVRSKQRDRPSKLIDSNTVTIDATERAKWDVKITTFSSLLEGLLHGDQDDYEAQDLRPAAKATLFFPLITQKWGWMEVCVFILKHM